MLVGTGVDWGGGLTPVISHVMNIQFCLLHLPTVQQRTFVRTEDYESKEGNGKYTGSRLYLRSGGITG